MIARGCSTMVKCKEMKKEIKDLRRAISRRDEMIKRLRGMEERRVYMNYLELIIRPRRLEYLSEYHFETCLRIVDPRTQTVPKVSIIRESPLHVWDLLARCPEQSALVIGEEIALALLKGVDQYVLQTRNEGKDP
jgi:hypothetical protein